MRIEAGPRARRSPSAAEAAAAPAKPSNYPEPFFSRMAKRQKRPLGDLFGLKNFGVNLTRLAPGGDFGAAPSPQPAGRVRLYSGGPADTGDR